MSDRQFLLTLRIILVTFTAGALLFALNSKSTMYEMVQNAYNVTLAGAFVPLVAGAYWKRANAYRCTSCGHAKDVLQKLSDPVLSSARPAARRPSPSSSPPRASSSRAPAGT
jgi:hypothetical protein